VQQLQPLGAELGTEEVDPRDVAGRPIEAGDNTLLDRIAASQEHDRDRAGRRLCGQSRIAASRGKDHGRLAAHKIGCERRQSIVLVFRKTVFDRYVAAFNVTGLTQAAAESIRKFGPIISPQSAEESDHRHHRLLRERRFTAS
jgi:hypothetical protein